jgi:hypothetical protein
MRKLTQPCFDVGRGDTQNGHRNRQLAWLSSTAALALLVALGLALPAAAGAAAQEDARAFFLRFVAAQNAHDAAAVRAMLWDSPEMLWYTRGTEVRGPAAVVEQLHGYYAGTWQLEPDMTKFRVTVLGESTVQLLVPVVFTRGAAGEPAQKNEFLICQTLVRGATGWQVASILPIANTQLQKSK